MVRTCVDSVLAELSYLEHLPLISSEHSPWAIQMVGNIQTCKLGLRFLRMILWSILTLEDTDDDDAQIKQILLSVNHTCEAKWGISRNQLVAFYSLAKARLECGNWVLDLHDRIHYCKQKFEESCELLLRCSLRCNSFKMKVTLRFVDAILKNLKDLYKYKTGNEIVLLKNQMETLEKKLRLLRDLFCLIPKQWRGFKEMEEFKVVVHAFAHYSASLIFLYWVKAIDEVMATKVNLLLFDVLQKIKPCDPVFKAFYFRFLKEMKLRQFDPLLLGQIVQIFLDLLLENLVVHISKEDFHILQESLFFVLSFLANPPDEHAEDEELTMITAEIEVLVKEDLYQVFSVYDVERNISKPNACLSGFMRKVELVKVKVRHIYDQIRDSFSYDLPKTNGLGFFDFLLQNLGFLNEKLRRDRDFIPFAKHMIIKIEHELMSLRPYLNDLFEQQKERKELKDTWLKVINLAYQTEYAINSCLVIGHRLWYNMARLMEVLDEIKVVKSKIKKIEIRRTHDCSVVAQNKVLEDPWASGFNEVMVGLEKELDIIVEKLIRGSKSLDIVAIFGMAGLGKTTLANKVYITPAVRYYFHIFAYCIVSQVHNVRKILLDILGDIKGKDDKMYGMMEDDTGNDDNMYDMMEEDLADMLRKCLKGKRYLIIMDDIWDVKAWDEVKNSFPDDRNGSRIIFTTRIHNVASQAKQDCFVHPLRFLSEEESWELLRKKAFRAEGFPLDFSVVGKMIAKNCKGLPLTIVLIASLLAKTESLSLWNKISETIGSYVFTEGCMDVLELSYQHLPEHLKPCFLYFGAFAEDTLIHVNKLMMLWIAEGFVHDSNRENLENVAKEYLCDLIDRSLVIPNERSSKGGIKNCRIHDLVHEFCQVKAQEENCFQLMDEYKAYDSSSSTIRNPYRVCVHTKGGYLSDASKICPSIHSLLYSRKWGSHRHGCHVLSNLKLVQVMDLEELELDTCSIKEIASLVHLRFIATSFHPISRIIVPSFISNLWNLEFLILTGSRRYRLELPGTIWNMIRLKHVDVGLCYVSNSGVKKRETYPEMVNLESFSSPTICSTKDLEDLLQRSPSLRKLSFHYAYPEEVEVENWFRKDLYIPKVGPSGILKRLKDFHFSKKLNSVSKLESLKVSSTRKLSLHSFNFLSTLKKLSLSGGYLPWIYLPTISTMPCLEVLKLLDNSFVGLEWDMEDVEFPKLKFLKLQRLHLDEWIAFIESFPCLEVLIVNKCYGLTIPACFGEMPTLKRIEVYESLKAAASVVELQEAQEDLGNEELQVIVSDPLVG